MFTTRIICNLTYLQEDAMVLNVQPGEFSMTGADIENLKHQYELDQPLPIRYVVWLNELVHVNLGNRVQCARQTAQSKIGRRPTMPREHSSTDGPAHPTERHLPPDFVQQVRDALRKLHDRTRLQTHSLTRFVSPQTDQRTIGRGKRLQNDLLEAIEDLRPDPGLSADSPAARNYHLLAWRYVEAHDTTEVQRHLAIGKTEYYADHQRALEAVALVLWDRWQPESASETKALNAMTVVPPREMPRSPPATDDKRHHNLPAQLTSFVAREREVGEICSRLTDPDVRLLTLTGPGGVGKTRLAIQIANDLASEFREGVYFVDLTTMHEVDRLLPAIAQVLELQESGQRPILETVRTYLRGRTILIVLDNFEQVLASGPVLTDLLATCPGLKFLVTSRSALRLRGEREVVLAPLDVPSRAPTTDPTELERCPAVRLFVARAREVRPEFVLSRENAPTVAEICRRLDGLPLAIELAAARIKVLPPSILLARLKDRLQALTGGARDLPERQQTLRGAIGWSYDLLDESECALFRRLGVFAGGFGLEAAEAVALAAGPLNLDPVDGIESLVGKSLLYEQLDSQGTVRFAMLDTIRDFALDALAECGERADVRAAHARYFFQIVTALEDDLVQFVFATHLVDLESDESNLVAAVAWAEEQGETEVALRVASALGALWISRGRLTEARTLLEGLLGQPRTSDYTAGRLYALFCLGWVLAQLGDTTAGIELHAEALPLSRRLGENRLTVRLLASLWGGGLYLTQWADGDANLEEARTLARKLGDDDGIAWVLNTQGLPHFWIARDLVEARRCWSEGLEAARRSGGKGLVAEMLNNLGLIAWLEGDLDAARRIQRECLHLRRALRDKRGVAAALDCLAAIAVDAGDIQRAMLIDGSVSHWRAETGSSQPRVWQDLLGTHVTSAREKLRSADKSWSAGQLMTLEQAVACALSDD